MRVKKYKDKYQSRRWLDFCRARCQARFRKEGWEITEQEYYDIWRDDLYMRKSRDSDGLCLTRIDIDEPWRKDNVAVVTRSLHFQIRTNRRYNQPYHHLFQQAEWVPQ